MDRSLVGSSVHGAASDQTVLDHLAETCPGRPLSRPFVQAWNQHSLRTTSRLGFEEVGELTTMQDGRPVAYRIVVKVGVAPVLGAGVGLRVRAEPGAVVESVERGHCSSVNSKSKTSRFSAMRSGETERGMTTLPSCMLQRISTCAGVLPCAGDRGDRRVVQQPADAQRAVGLGDDAVLGVRRAQLGLIEQRMQLDLVDRGHEEGQVDDRRQVLGV